MKRTILLTVLFVGMYVVAIAQQKSETYEAMKKEIKKEVLAEIGKEKAKSGGLLNKISKTVSFSGRGLLRLGEFDFDQKRMTDSGDRYTAGNRYWSRYNFYLNMDIKLSSAFKLHSRIRTGQKQYSFVTFGGNQDERFNIILDEFYLNWSKDNYFVKLGRQSAGAVWKNQKGAQFDIPTHDGITAGKSFNVSDLDASVKAAFFNEQYRNDTQLGKQGKIYGFSLTLGKSAKNIAWHLHSGMIWADHLPNRYQNDIATKTTPRYHDGDLADAYSIWVIQGKISLKNAKNLSFTVDYYNNFKNYDVNPQSHMIKAGDNGTVKTPAPDFTNENQGFIATLGIGSYAKSKSFYASAAYLYLEKYAVMDYFAQYDFARWASSNIQGTEFVLAYRFNKYLGLKGRLYFTKELKGLNAADVDYKRSGNRFRLDLNINF